MRFELSRAAASSAIFFSAILPITVFFRPLSGASMGNETSVPVLLIGANLNLTRGRSGPVHLERSPLSAARI